ASMSCLSSVPARTLTYTLSLHDALPIYFIFFHAHRHVEQDMGIPVETIDIVDLKQTHARPSLRGMLPELPDQAGSRPVCLPPARSEEHTSELQSRENLVCRLLLEKKKKK